MSNVIVRLKAFRLKQNFSLIIKPFDFDLLAFQATLPMVLLFFFLLFFSRSNLTIKPELA